MGNDHQNDNDNEQTNWKPGEWMHKEHFLCAFTAPELLASYQSKYEIVTTDATSTPDSSSTDAAQPTTTQRLLTLSDRATKQPLWGPLDLELPQNRDELAAFLSQQSKTAVTCVTAGATFQFGNTSSGVKHRKGDSRTIHIVNQATVDALAAKISRPLTAARFRPNMVLQGVPAWHEFDWVRDQATLEHPAM